MRLSRAIAFAALAISAISHAQPDHVTAAQILDLAEKQSHQIKDKSDRIIGLCAVARAIAPTDKPRARELLNEARSINPLEESIYDSWTLIDVAEALQLAQDNSAQIMSIDLGNLIERDPEGIARIISTCTTSNRGSAASDAVQIECDSASPQCLDFVEHLAGIDVKPMYQYLAGHSPDRHVAELAAQRSGVSAATFYEHIAQISAAADPHYAENLIRQLEDPIARYTALSQLALKISSTNGPDAKRIAKEVSAWWSSLPQDKKQDALENILLNLSGTGEPEIAAMLVRCEDGSRITLKGDQWSLAVQLLLLAEAWCDYDVSKATELVDEALSLDQFHVMQAGRGEDSKGEPDYGSFLERLAARDPQRVVDYVKKVDPEMLEPTLQRILDFLMQAHPVQANSLAYALGGTWPQYVDVRMQLTTIDANPQLVPKLLPLLEKEFPEDDEFEDAFEFQGEPAIQALAKVDAVLAAKSLPALRRPEHRAEMAAVIIPYMAKTDPAAAQSLLDEAFEETKALTPGRLTIFHLLRLYQASLSIS